MSNEMATVSQCIIYLQNHELWQDPAGDLDAPELLTYVEESLSAHDISHEEVLEYISAKNANDVTEDTEVISESVQSDNDTTEVDTKVVSDINEPIPEGASLDDVQVLGMYKFNLKELAGPSDHISYDCIVLKNTTNFYQDILGVVADSHSYDTLGLDLSNFLTSPSTIGKLVSGLLEIFEEHQVVVNWRKTNGYFKHPTITISRDVKGKRRVKKLIVYVKLD